jgi:hypothetical protein
MNTCRPAAPAANVAKVADWLRLFIAPGQVTELRALNYTTEQDGRYAHTVVGYYDHDHLGEMAGAALRLTRDAEGVYFVPNLVSPDLLARAVNRTRKAKKGEAVTDGDILRRRWVLVDADPQRPAGISSTEQEKAAAWEAIQAAGELLAAHGITRTVLADSGNGYHRLVPVDLPADDGGMVRLLLQSLAARLDTPNVKIDTAVYNPARICKLYGTWSRKGDDMPERPHRQSRVLEVSE